MCFGNLILNKHVKIQEKILLFVFLKSAQLWHRIYLGQVKHIFDYYKILYNL
jgi:hypothetical protein